MAIHPKATPSSSPNLQDGTLKIGDDVETGLSTESHSAVEQLEDRPNPLIESVEGGQSRAERGNIEGSVESRNNDIERQ